MNGTVNLSGSVATGARRLASPTTYAVLSIGLLAGVVVPYLAGLGFDAATSDGRPVGFLLVAFAWIYAVAVWTVGALATASVLSDARLAAVIRGSLSSYGGYLVGSLIVSALALAAGSLVVLISLVGLGGQRTSPVVGVLSPLAVAGAGVTLPVVVVLYELAMASVAISGCSGATGVLAAWRILCTRPADAFLWVGVTAAINVGLFVSVGVPLLAGGWAAVVTELTFLARGAERALGSSPAVCDVVDQYVLAGTILLLAYAFIAGIVLGALRAFALGSAVGFLQPSGLAQSAQQPRPPFLAAYCDLCGNRIQRGAPFCESCGGAVARA